MLPVQFKYFPLLVTNVAKIYYSTHFLSFSCFCNNCGPFLAVLLMLSPPARIEIRLARGSFRIVQLVRLSFIIFFTDIFA